MVGVKFIDLGLESYRKVWDLQEKLLEEVRDKKLSGIESDNYLLFVEHPHVYTLGKSGNEANMLINTIQLSAKNAEFVKVDRGGDITYHGPGQQVAYPIFDLERFNLGVKDYVYTLEEVIIDTIAEYGVKGERMDGATGVWLDVGGISPRKICAIGIRCSRFVTMHGFALNVNSDLNYFNYINPCGFVDKGVTSISKEIDANVDIKEIKEKLKSNFQKHFGIEWHK